MEDYQQRVRNEKKELDEKIEKLQKFILSEKFESLPKEQQHLLIHQKYVMNEYTNILIGRIMLF